MGAAYHAGWRAGIFRRTGPPGSGGQVTLALIPFSSQVSRWFCSPVSFFVGALLCQSVLTS